MYPVGGVESPIECFRCGICCVRYQANLTDKDIQVLAENLGLSRDDLISKYVQTTVVGYLLRHEKHGCVFLKWENGEARASCAVHSFRPECCRAWAAGLSRPECKEGLARLKSKDKIIRVDEIYPSQEEKDRFCSSMGD